MTYGNAAPSYSLTYSGFATGESASNLSGTASYTIRTSNASATSGTVVSDVTQAIAGTYYIWPSGLTSSNYTITFACGTLTINKRAITITADSNSKTYDGTALTDSGYTISSGSLASEDSITTCTVSGTITNVGSAQQAPQRHFPVADLPQLPGLPLLQEPAAAGGICHSGCEEVQKKRKRYIRNCQAYANNGTKSQYASGPPAGPSGAAGGI